jgi:hypothetical protein
MSVMAKDLPGSNTILFKVLFLSEINEEVAKGNCCGIGQTKGNMPKC